MSRTAIFQRELKILRTILKILILHVFVFMLLRAPMNGKIAFQKANASGVNGRNIFIGTILSAFLRSFAVFLRLRRIILRLARFYFVHLRIIILRLARLYAAVVRFERSIKSKKGSS